MAFISAVVVGASRFAHAGWLRHDTAFHAPLGLKRFPTEDAIRRFFHRFTQAHIEAFWRPLWRWMLELLEAPKGYNPRRPGRKSHHPILAEMPFVLHAWLRSGNTGAGRGVVEGGNYEVSSLRVKLVWGKRSEGLRCCGRKSGRTRRRWDAVCWMCRGIPIGFG